MKNNQINESSQIFDSTTNEPTPEKIKEPRKEKPDVIEPDTNDPTRIDKPPLIISKL